MTKDGILYRDVAISGLSLGIVYYCYPRQEILIVGGIYVLCCLLWTQLRRANHHFWVIFTRGIQTVTSPLLFGAIFLLVVVPLGLLYRLWHRKEPQKDSSFTVTDQSADPAFFEVPW